MKFNQQKIADIFVSLSDSSNTIEIIHPNEIN